MTTIPAAFAQTILDMYGEEGAAWLQQLPNRLATYAQRWSLQFGAPFSLSLNYVLPAVQADGRAVVLKVSYPSFEYRNEMTALRLYNGDGMVQLLDATEETEGVMLLERLLPGEMLASLPDDEEATLIAATIMHQLWRPVPADHPFPTVADWAMALPRHRARFDGGLGPLPRALFEQAEWLIRERLAENAPPMLLHGDLHHYNILRAQRRPWLAIDPKGLVGDPAYDLGAFLYNPGHLLEQRADLDHLLQRRVDLLADSLAFTRERVRDWGIIQAVISACWSAESPGYGWEHAIEIGSRLAKLTV
ncbi:MAG: phosphotransferase [Caldilineaceae bacterium]|nr:phosphotransferase [Caldilineaceae bacterium]